MKLSEYLTSLGSTSEEVAESLRKQGIKGVKESQCHCPILNAIYQALPDYWSGLKIRGSQRGGYHAMLNDSQISNPTLPEPVQAFIFDFDMGKYPDLVATKVIEKTVRVWE